MPEGTGYELACYACSGADPSCPVCAGRGTWELRRCPGAVMEMWAVQTVELASLALGGLGWPAPGGVLDQSELFLHALRIVESERARAEAEARESQNQSKR